MNRRWFAGLLTLVLPVLLAAPPVWVLKRHAAELRSGEQLLRREILRLDRAIVEIQALDRTKASFLGRKSVVEVLDENRTHAVRLLNALGTLPPGLQLKTLVTRGDAVTLTGVAVVPIDEAVKALTAAGLDNISVAPAATSPRNAASPFEIQARFTGEMHGAAAEPAP